MNVLFVGNSYTHYHNLDKLFEGLCRENGKEVCAYRVTAGGRSMIQYTSDTDPTTQRLKEMLQERRYDTVFLQEQSLLPLLDYDAFLAGMQYVNGLVTGHCSEVILYATWARKAGSPDLAAHGWTPETMTARLDAAYRKVAAILGAKVSPVGFSFHAAIQAAPQLELYAPDLYHPSYEGSCLAALTHYHTLFGAFPENTQSLSLEEGVLAVLKAAVYRRAE